MTDELLAYLLDDLSEDRRHEVEERLKVDPEWRRELARLQQCLAQGDEADPDDHATDPSDDLVDRTCCLVDRVCSRLASAGGRLSEASDGGHTARWSMADVLVGAGVLLIGASLLLPAIRQIRDASRRVTCENNLRTLGTALFEYSLHHHNRLPRISPQENAGAYAVKLADAGVIRREQLAQAVVCPDAPLAEQVRSHRVNIIIPSRDQLEQADGILLQGWWRRMGGSYAYPFGYFDAEGAYHQAKYTGSKYAPLLGDAPSLQLPGVGSANHGGCGQYILHQDLSAKFFTTCVAGAGCDQDPCAPQGDHVYLNDANDHAAGLGPDDVVLGRSEYTPLGPLNPVPKSLAAGFSTSPALWIYITGVKDSGTPRMLRPSPGIRP